MIYLTADSKTIASFDINAYDINFCLITLGCEDGFHLSHLI